MNASHALCPLAIRYRARTKSSPVATTDSGPRARRLRVEVGGAGLVRRGLPAVPHRLRDEATPADGLELAAEQVLQDVGEMNGEIEADRTLLAEMPPCRQHDPVVAADERRRREMDLAEHPRGDHGASEAVRRTASPLLLDGEDRATACRRLGHDPAAEDRDRQRLLAQHVTAGKQRRDRDPVVGRRLRGDVERDDRLVGEHLVERGQHGRPTAEERLGVVGAPVGGRRVKVADRDKVELEEADVGERRESAQVAAAHRAGSDEDEREPGHRATTEARLSEASAGRTTNQLSPRPGRGTSIRAGTGRRAASRPRR